LAFFPGFLPIASGVLYVWGISKMRPYAYVVWHSPHHRVAFAASSCGFRRIVVWLPPHRRVAFAASSYGFRRIVVWLPPLKIFLVFRCSLTLLVDYFKPYF